MTTKKFCLNCSKILGDNDKFCKYCGTEAVDNPEDFQPARMISAIVYGPPYSAKYVCPACGKVYIERGLGSPHTRYCTECGAKYDMYDSSRF